MTIDDFELFFHKFLVRKAILQYSRTKYIFNKKLKLVDFFSNPFKNSNTSPSPIRLIIENSNTNKKPATYVYVTVKANSDEVNEIDHIYVGSSSNFSNRKYKATHPIDANCPGYIRLFLYAFQNKDTYEYEYIIDDPNCERDLIKEIQLSEIDPNILLNKQTPN